VRLSAIRRAGGGIPISSRARRRASVSLRKRGFLFRGIRSWLRSGGIAWESKSRRQFKSTVFMRRCEPTAATNHYRLLRHTCQYG